MIIQSRGVKSKENQYAGYHKSGHHLQCIAMSTSSSITIGRGASSILQSRGMQGVGESRYAPIWPILELQVTMDPHTSMHESDLDPSSASVSPTTPGVYSQGEVVADEDNGQDWSDWDDDGSDEEYRAGTERGMAQLKLEHTSLSTTLPRVNSQNEFILHIEGLREGGGEVIVRVVRLACSPVHC